MRKVRKHLSFANVMSLIAVFIVLGGSAYAVKLSGKTIKNNTIAKKKLKKNVLKGLDTCPSAAPTNLSGICYGPAQAATTWDGAVQATCPSQKLRAPTIGEAILVMNAVGGGPGNETWTDEIADTNPPNTRGLVTAPGGGSGQIFSAGSGTLHSVRCVTNATNPTS